MATNDSTASALRTEAMDRFRGLRDRVRQLALREPAAMTLATSDGEGRVTARVVLLRAFDERGFVFYTNMHSTKGRQLAENPRAAICFYWDELAEQVRVEGTVELVADAEADDYWAGRPRDSQIGAWASLQSQTLDDRDLLAERVARFSDRFQDRPVPRPPHWSGYRLDPLRIEFWKAGAARLHERIVYELTGAGWTKRQLFP